jgi:hypothetical protein
MMYAYQRELGGGVGRPYRGTETSRDGAHDDELTTVLCNKGRGHHLGEVDDGEEVELEEIPGVLKRCVPCDHALASPYTDEA